MCFVWKTYFVIYRSVNKKRTIFYPYFSGLLYVGVAAGGGVDGGFVLWGGCGIVCHNFTFCTDVAKVVSMDETIFCGVFGLIRGASWSIASVNPPLPWVRIFFPCFRNFFFTVFFVVFSLFWCLFLSILTHNLSIFVETFPDFCLFFRVFRFFFDFFLGFFWKFLGNFCKSIPVKNLI